MLSTCVLVFPRLTMSKSVAKALLANGYKECQNERLVSIVHRIAHTQPAHGNNRGYGATSHCPTHAYEHAPCRHGADVFRSNVQAHDSTGYVDTT